MERQIELGEEYTNSSISYLTSYIGTDISDGDTQVKENNFAGFTQITQKFGNLNIGLGVRFEYGNYKYYDGMNHNKDINRTYRNLYPSFSLSPPKSIMSTYHLILQAEADDLPIDNLMKRFNM